VRILQPADDPVQAIEQILREDCPEAAKQRQDVARANSWDARFEAVQGLLANALASKGILA
jgi:hypothetical protein